MDPTRATLCATLIATLAGPAQATSHWICNLSADGVRLICVADREPDAEAPKAAVTTAMVNGTRFPLDVQRRYVVDLWSPPTDPEFVALLARATICYRSPDCEVSMAPSPWLQALARR